MQKTVAGRIGMTVEEYAKAAGIARGSAYAGVRNGDVPSVRIGRRIIVAAHALEQLRRGETPKTEAPADSRGA